MNFNDTYNSKNELFEAAKKKKKAKKPTKKVKAKAKPKKKKDDKLAAGESLITDKLVFPTEERAILNLGDAIATVVKNMGDIEQQIKDAVKDKDKPKADQLERQIDDYKAKLDKLTVAEKKAIDELMITVNELLQSTDDKQYEEVLNTVKKKYK